ncbi:hypothetical protein DFJ58DRAFT_794092 [Suillus subalutaceus]|uniref:uncharacterized protein n=1 Tax=Suillus subalutaceus TaxID=48586 RepID=UPI001B875B4F|nr:uncharacterized protein DFJ58DRAFT_794092 [Suillus subalutaceus]KAG1850209.1 hypothetical protein DFJ58DRAFT_794092 [Suillus subalutaceus]
MTSLTPNINVSESTWTPAFVIPAFISPQAPTTPKHLQSMAFVEQVIHSLGGKHLVNSLITTVERLAQTTDVLSSDVITTLASITLLVGNLTTTVEHLSQKTDTLSSDVGATIALLGENLIVTTNVLALDMHYLLQGCIALVALLCLLTVLCIVRWCYAFTRELRGVQHLKTA